jgi:hypothetical protein
MNCIVAALIGYAIGMGRQRLEIYVIDGDNK